MNLPAVNHQLEQDPAQEDIGEHDAEQNENDLEPEFKNDQRLMVLVPSLWRGGIRLRR